MGGRKEKSLTLVQTNRVERTFSARSVQVHTHLCRGSLSSGCRARWPIRHAESAARGAAICASAERSAAQPRSPVRQRPPGTQTLPFFSRSSFFSRAVWTPRTENETAAEKPHKPNLNPKPAGAGSAVDMPATLRPATARRASLSLKNVIKNSAVTSNPPRNSLRVPVDQAGLAEARCCHGSVFRLSCISD